MGHGVGSETRLLHMVLPTSELACHSWIFRQRPRVSATCHVNRRNPVRKDSGGGRLPTHQFCFICSVLFRASKRYSVMATSSLLLFWLDDVPARARFCCCFVEALFSDAGRRALWLTPLLEVSNHELSAESATNSTRNAATAATTGIDITRAAGGGLFLRADVIAPTVLLGK